MMTDFQSNKTKSFQVRKFQTRSKMGKAAADDVQRTIMNLLGQKETINMIFAAAPSQLDFLQCLCEDKSIDFSRIHAYHMDEYIGLDADAPQGFGNFLKKYLFSKVNFKSIDYLNGGAADIESECERYSNLIRKQCPDIVCMGIGENGHIAFNDPDEADFNDPKLVKVVELDDICRQQQVNDKCFVSIDLVPKKALSLTIPALADAAYHFCIVPAAAKADAVYRTIYGPISENCPATILRKCENSILYIDSDSARLL